MYKEVQGQNEYRETTLKAIIAFHPNLLLRSILDDIVKHVATNHNSLTLLMFR